MIMIKKLNLLVLLLIILLSLGAVSASEDINLTDDDANSDLLEVSADDNAELTAASHTINQNDYSKYFDNKGNLIDSTLNSGDTVYLNGSFSNLKFTFNKQVNIVGTSTNDMKNTMIT